MRSDLLTGLLATVLVATGPAALLTASGAGAATGETVAALKPVVKRGSVTDVVDGDTIDVLMPSGAEKRVRLLGIDTPEVFGEVECGGPEASAWTKRYLPVGTRVELVSDPSQSLKDQYGRQLRYVTKLSTGKDVNRRLVAKGWATLFVWDGDPFARVTSYRKALRSAKDAGRGIWGLC
jgi:endonuclease YncB( thermonuclease family)